MKKGNKTFKINYMTLDSNKPFSEILLRISNEKNLFEIDLEDFLINDDYCSDLIINKNSNFKTLLTFDNIIKIIKFSLSPFEFSYTNSQQEKNTLIILVIFYATQVLFLLIFSILSLN